MNTIYKQTENIWYVAWNTFSCEPQSSRLRAGFEVTINRDNVKTFKTKEQADSFILNRFPNSEYSINLKEKQEDNG